MTMDFVNSSSHLTISLEHAHMLTKLRLFSVLETVSIESSSWLTDLPTVYGQFVQKPEM